MKKLVILLLILNFTSHFGTNEIFSQKKIKPKEVIIIEFAIPIRNNFEKWEVPINNNPKGKLDNAGMSIDECGIPGKCGDHVYSTYTFSAKAFRMGKIRTKVDFKIEVTDGCKTQKLFTVNRKQQTNIQLECGVKLVAYYGFENKKAN